jgi:hypothetical protein
VRYSLDGGKTFLTGSSLLDGGRTKQRLSASLLPGTYTLHSAYGGGGVYAASIDSRSSSERTFTVPQVATTLTLETPSQGNAASSSTRTVTVPVSVGSSTSGAAAPGGAGTVQYQVDSTSPAGWTTATNNSSVTPALTLGPHTIYVRYRGTDVYADSSEKSVSVTVTQVGVVVNGSATVGSTADATGKRTVTFSSVVGSPAITTPLTGFQPSGTAKFFLNNASTSFGSQAVTAASPTGTAPTQLLAPGTYTLGTSFETSGIFANSTDSRSGAARTFYVSSDAEIASANVTFSRANSTLANVSAKLTSKPGSTALTGQVLKFQFCTTSSCDVTVGNEYSIATGEDGVAATTKDVKMPVALNNGGSYYLRVTYDGSLIGSIPYNRANGGKSGIA